MNPSSRIDISCEKTPIPLLSFSQSWLIGRPLQISDAEHQAISRKVGLAVFAVDAPSSWLRRSLSIRVFGRTFYTSKHPTGRDGLFSKQKTSSSKTSDIRLVN